MYRVIEVDRGSESLESVLVLEEAFISNILNPHLFALSYLTSDSTGQSPYKTSAKSPDFSIWRGVRGG